MPNWKDLDTIPSAATDDEILVRDVSDTTDDAGGTLKRISKSNLGPATWQGACVYLTATEAIGAGVSTLVPWDAEEEDVGGWWTSGSPTRLTVPSGVSRVRVYGMISWASAGGQGVAALLLNGATTRMPANENDTDGSDLVCFASRAISVSPGDYFEISVFSTNARNIDVDKSYFAIEAVGG